MSEINKDEELGIRYILDTEFVLDPTDLNNEGLNDIIYTDGNQAFVLNGHILQGTSGESPTLVLQEGEDINQYLINDDKGELLIANIQNGIVDQTPDNQHIIQYVDEDGNIIDQPEIVYINENGVHLKEENSLQYQFAELMDTENSLPENGGDGTRLIDLESLVEKNGDASNMELNAADWYQYTVVKDNEFHYALHTSDSNEVQAIENCDSSVDVSTITGKNLLTGQTVTLESYMDKIKKKLKTMPTNSLQWKKPKHNLNAFVNKKFNLGLSVGGKQLVGKIVHVCTKDEPDKILEQGTDYEITKLKAVENNEGSSIENLIKINSKNEVHYQTKLLSNKSDQFQRISKTLSSLMNMDNVRSQLSQKSIRIKLIDKHCDNQKKITKNVSFISGYMESKIVSDDKNQLTEEFTFVPDTLKIENIRSNIEKKSQLKYSHSVDLTIVTTHQKTKSFVKVILNSKNQMCNHCDKVFNTSQNLISHINEEHKQCELCNCVFEHINDLNQHKNIHIESGELKTCHIGSCQQYFSTESALKKHMASHKLEAFKCPMCSYNGMNEADLKLHAQSHPNSCAICGEIFINETELKVHKRSHQSKEINIIERMPATKYYACDVCKRTFSRQSNLQRHVDIHKGAEQLYRCAICGCSYHYISSLTRHIVQNHIQVQRNNLINAGEVEKLF